MQKPSKSQNQIFLGFTFQCFHRDMGGLSHQHVTRVVEVWGLVCGATDWSCVLTLNSLRLAHPGVWWSWIHKQYGWKQQMSETWWIFRWTFRVAHCVAEQPALAACGRAQGVHGAGEATGRYWLRASQGLQGAVAVECPHWHIKPIWAGSLWPLFKPVIMPWVCVEEAEISLFFLLLFFHFAK